MFHTIWYRIVHRFFRRTAPLLEFFQFCYKNGIFFQPSASNHQLPIISMVNIEHADRKFQAGFRRLVRILHKCICQAQDTLFFHFLIPIVEHDTSGRRKPDQAAAVNSIRIYSHIGFIFCCRIEKKTQRQIGTNRTLMFIEVQGSHQHKCHIVVHGQIQHIVQCNNL